MLLNYKGHVKYFWTGIDISETNWVKEQNGNPSCQDSNREEDHNS